MDATDSGELDAPGELDVEACGVVLPRAGRLRSSPQPVMPETLTPVTLDSDGNVTGVPRHAA